MRTQELFEALEPRHTLSAASAITPRNIGAPDLVPGNANTLQWIAVGGSARNAINFRGDRDWYRISLEAGRAYQFRLNSSVNVPGVQALSDAFLYLRNSAGTIVRQDDDSGGNNNSLIQFTAPSSGTYFLDAAGHEGRHFGTYTLTATRVGPVDDFAANMLTTGGVAVNGSINGVVNTSGDRDWFRVWLVAGRSYRFDVTSGSVSDPDLNFRNRAGTVLLYNDDFGGTLNPRITYRPASTGYFYLDVGGRNNWNVGSYTVRVAQM
jgi:serralysin